MKTNTMAEVVLHVMVVVIEENHNMEATDARNYNRALTSEKRALDSKDWQSEAYSSVAADLTFRSMAFGMESESKFVL
jgi:hypothetical protein